MCCRRPLALRQGCGIMQRSVGRLLVMVSQADKPRTASPVLTPHVLSSIGACRHLPNMRPAAGPHPPGPRRAHFRCLEPRLSEARRANPVGAIP